MATQTLTFVKVGEEYVAAFEISANFALHLEREEVGSLSLGISSIPDSEFALVDNIPERARYQTVFDYTFSGDVFPKYVKVASVTYPNIAVVVSEGEITPIEIIPNAFSFAFNIPMTEDNGAVTGEKEGNYTGTYNTMAAFAKAYGTTEDYGYSVKDEETLRNVDLKVNSYNVNEVEYHESDEFIKMQTDALSSADADGAAVLRKGSVSFAYALPVEEPESPEDDGILTYAFNVPVNEVGGYYAGSLEGDFAKLKNDLLQIMKAEGWDDDYDTLDGSLLEGKVNITFNGYSPLYYEYYDNKIVMGTDLNNWLVGGDLQSRLTDTSIYIEIPQPWNPDAPKPESDVIEYHFEIPMEYDFSGYAGSLDGDFSELHNKLESFITSKGSNEGDMWSVGGELLSNNVNVTANDDKVTSIEFYPDSGEMICWTTRETGLLTLTTGSANYEYLLGSAA